MLELESKLPLAQAKKDGSGSTTLVPLLSYSKKKFLFKKKLFSSTIKNLGLFQNPRIWIRPKFRIPLGIPQHIGYLNGPDLAYL